MKRFLKVIFAISLVFALTLSASAEPSLISESAVLMDADTGQILFDKEMHAKRYPASITKIATVICGLERGNLSDKIVMSEEAISSVSRDSSHIALDYGEEITLEQASYAALLVSANDACNGIAEATGGTIENFVSIMNGTARNAGAKNTNFVNANGLRDENHYTTAYDMACITRYALKNEDFRKIFGTYKYTMPPNNKQPESRLFVNQHYMISDPALLYDGFIGGKTGWTTDAHYTLVTAAERDGKTLIAVVMKSPKNYDKYTDTAALLDYGFNEFDTITLTNADLPRRKGMKLESPVKVSVPKGTTREDITVTATMEDGVDYAVVTTSTGREIGRFPCLVAIDASAEVPKPTAKTLHPLLILGIIILSVIALFWLFVLVLVIRKKIYRALRRRRRRRRR